MEHEVDSDHGPVAGPMPWWVAGSGRSPCPLGTPWLGGGTGGWRSGLLTIAVVSLLLMTRIVAFPSSIWDQDEAYLGLAVVEFDPVDNQPHPPWFPGWVAAGRLLVPVVARPADGLRILSALASVWTIFPMVALFAIWMRRELAVASALLYLCLPGPWFLSGRAFSDVPGTFMLLLTSAWWLRASPSRNDLLLGSTAGGLCLLVRPQLALPVLGLLFWRLVTSRGQQRLAVAGPLITVVGIGLVGLVGVAGGIAPLAEAFGIHSGYQLGGLDWAEFDPRDCGLSRALIAPGLAVAWLVLATVGLLAWARWRRIMGSPVPFFAVLIVPLAITVFGLSNPEITRYALPLLAVTSGPVVLGAAVFLGRLAPVAAVAAVSTSLVIGLPQAWALRSQLSPPVAALERADGLAGDVAGTLVVERTLLSFADYLAVSGDVGSDLVADFSIEIGAVDPPNFLSTMAVFPRGRGGFVLSSSHHEDFSCPVGWMRRLEARRFLDLRVAVGAEVEARRTRW